MACLAVVGVPTGLVLTSGGGPVVASPTKTHRGQGDNAPAERRVLAALSATTDSGSFDVTYQFEAPTAPTTPTTTVPCPTQLPSAMRFGPTGTSKLSVGSTGTGTGKGTAKGTGTGHGTGTTATCGGHSRGMSVAGHGTIDTDPYAMVATTVTAWARSPSEPTGQTSGSSAVGLGLPPGATARDRAACLGVRQPGRRHPGPPRGSVRHDGVGQSHRLPRARPRRDHRCRPTGTGTVDGTAVTRTR